MIGFDKSCHLFDPIVSRFDNHQNFRIGLYIVFPFVYRSDAGNYVDTSGQFCRNQLSDQKDKTTLFINQ